MIAKVYVAGPMRGYPKFNFPAFDAAAEYMRTVFAGEVVNPADHDRKVYPDIESWPGFATGDVDQCPKFSFAAAMKWDLQQVLESDDVFVLPGWEKSTGARHEVTVALTAGIPVHSYLPDAPWGSRIGDRITALPPIEVTTAALRDSPLDPGYLPMPGEVRVTDPKTGGQKGQKLARFDLLPVGPLTQIAEVYGKGAQKYAERNWERGYDWSLSYAALQRHLTAFWGGEDFDPELGTNHLANAAFHVLALLEFGKTHPELDNRPKAKEGK